VQPPVCDRIVDGARISRFEAEERFLSIRDRDGVARLLRETDGRFDCAVTSSHNEDLAALVGLRIEEAVGDLRQLFSGNA
jgi:hypothetical protein